MMSLDDIRNVVFSRGRGYRADEVNDFIDECVAVMEQLMHENTATNQKMKVLADKLAEYRNDEDSIRAALLNAQRTGDSIIRDAEEKAKQLLESAAQEAETARRQLLADIESEKEELACIKRQVSEFKEKLLGIYKEHLSLVKLLPEESAQPPASVEEPVAEKTIPAETADDDSDMIVVAPVSEEPVQADEDEEMKPLSRFSDLKFGNDYDIHQDDDDFEDNDETSSRGLFRKKK